MVQDRVGSALLPQRVGGREPDLTDLIDTAVLQELQDRFAIATGVASIITTPDGTPITEPSQFSRLCRDVIRKTVKGLQNCMRSDAILGRPNPSGPLVSPCLSCGLWDGGASIFAGDRHVANWLVGQVRNEELRDGKILEYAREIGADEVAFREAFFEVNKMSTGRFQAVCDFLFLMANQLSSTAYQRVLYIQQEEERRALAQQLEQSRKLQAVGQLAGGVAHDFNNLLTTVLGYTQLLMQDVAEGQVSRDGALAQLGAIQAAGLRAADLTKQLLAFSRQQVSVPDDVDLSGVVIRFESVLRSLVPESIQFDILVQPGETVIRANRSQVEQVILNLVVNARDAMHEGGRLALETARVILDDEYVTLHPDAQTGPHVRLTVSDTGVGMSEAVRARLFEPFFTTKAPGKGTGLGLATAYGVVRQADGHVSVHSEEGAGSVFRVYWPASGGAARELDDTAIPGDWLGSEYVLVCEDSTQVRDLAARILSRVGYRVAVAGTGEEALAVLSGGDTAPDLLLTDVIMPGMNGWELAEKAAAIRPGIRVVFMSGYTADMLDVQRILDPQLRLIEKPFTTDALLSAVRGAFDHA